MATGNVNPKAGKILDLPANAPTIGTATDLVNDGQVSVAFTAGSTAVGGPVFYYTATSNPGSISVNGTSSPITVTGLTNGTSYTFTVKGTNPSGSSPLSSASNSVSPSAPPGNFEPIATTILSTSASSITISSIPTGYRHLELRYNARTNAADGVSDVYLQLNGNSTSIYSNLTSGVVNGSTERLRQLNTANASMGYIGGNSSTVYSSSGIIRIPYYTNTNYNKTYYYRTGVAGSGSVNMGNWNMWGGGLAALTDAVTSVTLVCSTMVSGSRLDLYGIKE